jgi:hypothetical protein
MSEEATIISDPDNGMGPCSPCADKGEETQGYDNWEIFGIPDFYECHSCVCDRTRDRGVPQEWQIEY